MAAITSAIADIIPTPHNTEAPPGTTVDPQEQHRPAPALHDAPTDSHALATADHEIKGAVHEAVLAEDVADLGWNQPKAEIPKPLVGGIENEELWLLIRRFNKQMYHVKQYPYAVPGGLDLNIADEEEFSPDKLRSNIERLYMTIGIGLVGASKHIVRLRSWKETQRTAWFCAAYFAAWFLDLLVPLILGTLVTLTVYPDSREYLFPPAPIALVSAKTGGVQKPKAGVLGSTDSATGAPENHKGEAVEAEASNFVNGIASVALTSATGKHPQTEDEGAEGSATDLVPDPTAIAVGAANAKDRAEGGTPKASHDKTKVPVETAMWTKMRPIMHGLADVTDSWERFANALSPTTPPFHQNTHRLRLGALVTPLLAASFFITAYTFLKSLTFILGFSFFGDPVIQPSLHWLNSTFPHWQKLLEVRNTILKGVPTNAQLTITLLRIGEANKAPLPPPPHTTGPPPSIPQEITDADLRATGAGPPLSATASDLDAAMAPDPSTPHETTGADTDASKTPTKHGGKTGTRVLSFLRGLTKGGVESALTADSLKASAGSRAAKDRRGVVDWTRSDAHARTGPVDFQARFHGHRGRVYITASATVPCVAFSTAPRKEEGDVHPLWSVPVAELAELRKVGGFGWKAKLVVGWALDREVSDGLEIVDRRGGRWKVTAVPLRDELFNRLVAMGGQKWEAW